MKLVKFSVSAVDDQLAMLDAHSENWSVPRSDTFRRLIDLIPFRTNLLPLSAICERMRLNTR